MIKLPLSCSAFGTSISLTPYYLAEEKFEEKKYEGLDSDTGPCSEGFPWDNVKIAKITRTGGEQVTDKLNLVGRTNSVWKKKSGHMSWSSTARSVLVIIVVLSA